MIDKKHIEQILKLNGLNPSSPDEEIKSLLLSARWHSDDIETAIVILREDPRSKEQHIDTYHQIINSDTKINPETLNALLGIDVEISEVTNSHRDELRHAYRMQILSLTAVSVFIAALFLIFAMWSMELGFFQTNV